MNDERNEQKIRGHNMHDPLPKRTRLRFRNSNLVMGRAVLCWLFVFEFKVLCEDEEVNHVVKIFRPTTYLRGSYSLSLVADWRVAVARARRKTTRSNQ
jgi:hypothetical protein